MYSLRTYYATDIMNATVRLVVELAVSPEFHWLGRQSWSNGTRTVVSDS